MNFSQFCVFFYFRFQTFLLTFVNILLQVDANPVLKTTLCEKL